MNLEKVLSYFHSYILKIDTRQNMVLSSVPNLSFIMFPCEIKEFISSLDAPNDEVDKIRDFFTWEDKTGGLNIEIKKHQYSVEYAKIDGDEYLYIFLADQLATRLSEKLQANQLDPLTSILHKNAIKHYVDNKIQFEKLKFGALYMIDVDFFKNINDNYGHIFGDKVIVAIANALKGIAGVKAKVGRVGGDEFVLFVEHKMDRDGIKNIARLIRYVLDNIKIEGEHFSITATIGISCFPKDGTSYDALYNCCDKALYRGKQKGRDCHIIYDPAMHENIDKVRESTSTTVTKLSIATFLNHMVRQLIGLKPSKESYLPIFKEVAEFFQLDRIVCLDEFGCMAPYEKEDTKESYKAYLDFDLQEYSEYFVVDHMLAINDIRTWQNQDVHVFEVLEKAKVQSTVQVLLMREEKVTGFLSFESIQSRRVWQAAEINYLIIISNLIASFYLQNAE